MANAINDTTPVDIELAKIIADSSPVTTIAGVIDVMTKMAAVLPDEDGLKWFNYLYLSVTNAIDAVPPAQGWKDPAWLTRLDVVFAGLYFAAVASWRDDPASVPPAASVPAAWAALFEARRRPHVERIQFALAGMNAHINRDLMVALVQTGRELNIPPKKGTPEYDDFQHVNDILEDVEAQVKQELLQGVIGDIAGGLGSLGDIIANWNVRAARENAWVQAQVLWALQELPALADEYVRKCDQIASFAGRGLLIPVGLSR